MAINSSEDLFVPSINLNSYNRRQIINRRNHRIQRGINRTCRRRTFTPFAIQLFQGLHPFY